MNKKYSTFTLVELLEDKKSIPWILKGSNNNECTHFLLENPDSKLEDKYPEFRYQLWEYRDAMLLLKITEQNIWQKSVSDTSDLKNFYKNNIKSYGGNNRNSFQNPNTTAEIPDEVLSDYQTFLMKSWIDELHSKFKVKVNRKVLSSIKKSL